MNAQNLKRFKELSPPVGRLFIAAIVRFPGPALAEPCRMSIVQSVVASCLMLLLLWMVQAQLTVRINVLQGKSFFFNWGCSYLWRNSVRDSEQFLFSYRLGEMWGKQTKQLGKCKQIFCLEILIFYTEERLVATLTYSFIFIYCLPILTNFYLSLAPYWFTTKTILLQSSHLAVNSFLLIFKLSLEAEWLKRWKPLGEDFESLQAKIASTKLFLLLWLKIWYLPVLVSCHYRLTLHKCKSK